MRDLLFLGGGGRPIGRAHVGIDPSLTGFAVCVIDDGGRWAAKVIRPESRGPERLHAIKRGFDRFLRDYAPSGVEDVAIEGLVLRSHSASVLGEVSGVVKEYLYSDRGIVPLSVTPAMLKKFVSGKGTGVSKAQVMMNVLKKWGQEIPDDNAADAYVLARICRGRTDVQYEADVVSRLQDAKYRA